MTIYLDTETTGLHVANGAALVEVAVVDADGAVLLHTLVNPGCPIPAAATNIHGITDAMVVDAPPAAEVIARVLDLARGQRVVIYNAAFDLQFFPGLGEVAASVECCMERYAKWRGIWSDYFGGYRWHKLVDAAEDAGHDWEGRDAHRALADALACRTVWLWLDRKDAEAEVRRAKYAERQAARELAFEIEEGWYLAESDRWAADETARARAKRCVAALEKRRLLRLRQAVSALRPVIQAIAPTAEEILAGAHIPASAQTIALVAKRTGAWTVTRRGWYATGSQERTPAFAESMAASLRRAKIDLPTLLPSHAPLGSRDWPPAPPRRPSLLFFH